MNTQHFIIQFATPDDIDGMTEVMNQNLLANKKSQSTEELSTNGFLLRGFTSVDIEKSIANTAYHRIFVAKNDEQIIGYVIGYDLKNYFPDYLNTIDVKPDVYDLFVKKKILYLRHIAKIGSQKGVASQLVLKLLDDARSREYSHVICHIAHEPIKNKVSISFHEKLGFKLIGEMKNETTEYGIYCVALELPLFQRGRLIG